MQPTPKDPISEGVKYFAEHTLSSPTSTDPNQTQKGLLNFCKRLNNIEREFISNALSNVQNQENNELESKLISKLLAPDTSALSKTDFVKNKMQLIWDKISGKKYIASEKVAEKLSLWASRNKPEYTEVPQEFSESISQIQELNEVNDLKRIMTQFNESSQSDTAVGWIKVANNEDKLLEKISTIIPNLDKAKKEGREVEGIANLTDEIENLKNLQKELLNSQSNRVSPQQKIINQKNTIEENIRKLDERQNYGIVGKKQNISGEILKTIKNAKNLLQLDKEIKNLKNAENTLTLVQEKKNVMSDEEITNLKETIQLLKYSVKDNNISMNDNEITNLKEIILSLNESNKKLLLNQ